MFDVSDNSIAELMDGAERGYLMQAHAKTGGVASDPVHGGCNNITAMTSVIAAFLVGAGDDSFVTRHLLPRCFCRFLQVKF
jgi:hypothetical protein